ncbi:MAG: hypothetical protein H0T46_34530 [Deltaproteobacteria bacterium]|nr:hypothetical protein [Deltaproteobacteria bacterium]
MVTNHLARSLLALGLVGCAVHEDDLDRSELDDLGETSQEVKNGASRDPQTFAAPLLTGKDNSGASRSCTLALIENDLALTSTDCADLTATRVTIAGVQTSVSVARVPWGGSPKLAVVQLRKPLPVVTRAGIKDSGLFRGPSATPLVSGQKVHCFGYHLGVFRQGQFQVVDVDGAGNYSLLGGLGGNGQPIELTSDGDGGAFCMNDAGAELVAIVFDPLNRKAAPVHTLGVALDDIRFVAARAREEVALSLINAKTGEALQGGSAPGVAAVMIPRAGNPASQAFYYWDYAANPTADIFVLVNARNGLCLSADNGVMKSRRCDQAQLTHAQRFWVQFDGADYRVRPHGAMAQAASPNGSSITFQTFVGAAEQEWAEWLNWF